MVCYFLSDVGVKEVVLQLKSFPSGTAEILREYLILVLGQNEVKVKVVEFCSQLQQQLWMWEIRGQNNILLKV